MKYPRRFSWFLGVALVMVALQSAACTYESCSSDADCDQAAGEVCILPGGSCGLKATFCKHGERRPCIAGTHSRGTTRGDYGSCNKDVDPDGGRVEVCVGGVWIASRTRFEEVRRAYVDNNYSALGIPRFDLAEPVTFFEALSKNELDAIDLAISRDRKEYVLCGVDEENTNFVVGDDEPRWISREICNGKNDDCDPDPKDTSNIAGLIDEDFIGQRAIRVIRGDDGRSTEVRDAALYCVTGQADTDGNCLCSEPGSLGACQRRGVQVCDPVEGSTTDFQLGCSSVSVEPDPTRLACNGQDDNCNGVVDEFLVSLPSISYDGQNTNNFDPSTNLWASAIIGPNARTNQLFAIERNARQANNDTTTNRLPKIDLALLDTSGAIGPVRREILRPGGATAKVDIFGVSPELHVVASAPDEATNTTSESAILFYLSQVEFNCTNGLDDDGDGLIDCEDRIECSPDQCGELNSGATACRDGRDGDRDGLIDCDDSECFSNTDCADSETCNDNRDNNNNGLTDCADPICFTDPDCSGTHFARPELCGNGLDDDGDGLPDCLDPECCSVASCMDMPACRIETLCDPTSTALQGLDGDGDGLIGCNDPDCCALTDCQDQGVCVRVCDDCNDPFCEGSPACPTYATANSSDPTDDASCHLDTCFNGTTTTCCGGANPDSAAKCRIFPECQEDCLDGVDNNGDGLTDCEDVRCANTPLCKRPTQRDDTCVLGDDVTVDCTNPDCRDALDPTRFCYNTVTPQNDICGNGENAPTCNPCLEDAGGTIGVRCKSDLACLYNAACLPCEFGGAACERTACANDPACAGGAPNCNDTANCSNPACADSPACYETCLTTSACDTPELCHNHIDDNGDGLIDCEDFDACGYSVFCTQELFALAAPFSFNSITGNLNEDSTPSTILTNDVCVTCSDDGVFQVNRTTDPSLGLSRPRFKNRPTFFDVLPRSNNSEFFVLYGREAQSGFRLYSALPKVDDGRVSTNTPQQARIVGSAFTGILRDVALSSVSATSSEVRMAVIEEQRNSDGIFSPTRLGALSLYRGSVTSTGAIDLYATEIKKLGSEDVTEAFLNGYEIPLTAYTRPGAYPMDILSFGDDTWLTFVAGSTTPELRLHGYRQIREGGLFNFTPIIEAERPVAYPLKRLNEGWVLAPQPVAGDDKNPANSAASTFNQVNNVSLAPVCFDLGSSRSQCDQMLLSFGERTGTDSSLHLLQVNITPDRTSRIGDTAAPAPIPLAAVINESKLREGQYQTIPSGRAPQTIIKREVVNGYRVQVGGFGVGQEPEFDFITSLTEVPEHIRFAKVVDAQNNLQGYFAQSQDNKDAPLAGDQDLEAEINKLPEDERITKEQVVVNLTETTRIDYHVHWGAIISTANGTSAPYVEELKCDTPPNPTFKGYGLTDPSALTATTEPTPAP